MLLIVVLATLISLASVSHLKLCGYINIVFRVLTNPMEESPQKLIVAQITAFYGIQGSLPCSLVPPTKFHPEPNEPSPHAYIT